MEVFIYHNSEKRGPYSIEELRERVLNGTASQDDLAWHEGLRDWMPLRQVIPLNTSYCLPRPPGEASTGNVFAGFWRRAAAFIIDNIVGLIVALPMGYVVGLLYYHSDGRDPEVARLLGNVVGITLGWVYFSAMESSRLQGTLGKMALGIKVTDTQGMRIGFGRASGRYFGKTVSTLILGIGYLMGAFTRRKQALHDIMAGCVVVDNEKLTETRSHDLLATSKANRGIPRQIIQWSTLIVVAIACSAYLYQLRNQVLTSVSGIAGTLGGATALLGVPVLISFLFPSKFRFIVRLTGIGIMTYFNWVSETVGVVQ